MGVAPRLHSPWTRGAGRKAVHTCLFQAAVFLGRSVLFRLGRKLREVEILAFRDGSEIWGCLWGWTPQKETISNLEICVNRDLLYLFITFKKCYAVFRGNFPFPVTTKYGLYSLCCTTHPCSLWYTQ